MAHLSRQQDQAVTHTLRTRVTESLNTLRSLEIQKAALKVQEQDLTEELNEKSIGGQSIPAKLQRNLALAQASLKSVDDSIVKVRQIIEEHCRMLNEPIEGFPDLSNV